MTSPIPSESIARKLSLGSLFAGIGGFDLGFERAGFTTSWTCEIDQQAQAVLRLRFPQAVHHDDVKEVGADTLEPVDVVTFGSPCQDLSLAGRRAGLAGGRSGLFHDAARIIRELRDKYGKPDLAVWENVPGAFSSNGGRDFAVVIQTLVDLGARDVAWRVLDSQGFGVPQRRRRCFVVADFRGERASQVLAIREGGDWHPKKGRAPREEDSSLAQRGARGGRGYRMRAFGYYADDDTASAMKQRDYKDATDLVTQSVVVGGAATQQVVRRLTPTECCRLQGFPDNWNEEGIDKSGRRIAMADASRYKQLGNAVTVNVAEWIAARIVAAFRRDEA